MSDALAHLVIVGLGGSDVGHRQLGVGRQPFRYTALAGACASEDQLFQWECSSCGEGQGSILPVPRLCRLLCAFLSLRGCQEERIDRIDRILRRINRISLRCRSWRLVPRLCLGARSWRLCRLLRTFRSLRGCWEERIDRMNRVFCRINRISVQCRKAWRLHYGCRGSASAPALGGSAACSALSGRCRLLGRKNRLD